MESNKQAETPQLPPPGKPGVCIPWEEKLKELPEISGDAQLARKVWEDIDGMGYTYVWHCLVSF
jgi:hypothetical protein